MIRIFFYHLAGIYDQLEKKNYHPADNYDPLADNSGKRLSQTILNLSFILNLYSFYNFMYIKASSDEEPLESII